jgi:hypothetical protein
MNIEQLVEVVEKFSKNLLKKNKGVPTFSKLPQKRRSDILKAYQKSKSQYYNSLSKNMAALRAGKMTKDDYLQAQRDAIKTHFTDAFTFGKMFDTGIAGISDDERRFIVQQTTKEMGFMANFAKDIVNGSGRMPYQRRLRMYSDSLDSMFTFGNLLYLPEDVLIIWTLGTTDKHCIDCLLNVAGNPYTKRTLPGVPKSGATTCLSNCRCSLNFVINGQSQKSDYLKFITSNSKKSGNVPSEEEYLTIVSMRNSYYYNRLMFEATKDKKFMDSAKAFSGEMRGFISRGNFAINLLLPVKTPVFELKSFLKNPNFSMIEKISDLKQNDFVSAFIGDRQIYGKVEKVYPMNVVVKMLDGTSMNISPENSIIFGEK